MWSKFQQNGLKFWEIRDDHRQTHRHTYRCTDRDPEMTEYKKADEKCMSGQFILKIGNILHSCADQAKISLLILDTACF